MPNNYEDMDLSLPLAQSPVQNVDRKSLDEQQSITMEKQSVVTQQKGRSTNKSLC